MPRNSQPRKHIGVTVALICIMVLLILGSALMIKLCIDLADLEPQTSDREDTHISIDFSTTPTSEPTVPETTLPVPEHVVSTATVVSTGDLLMHLPVVNSGRSGSGYDFESIFRYISDDISAADYAVANLETTLASTTNGYAYSGYPNFNCPDDIVTSAREAGFDMLLNANNHSYDTSSVGMHRTIRVIEEAGLDTLGIVDADTDPRYLIKEINGIRIGMLCYTYETDENTAPERVALNGLPVKVDDAPLINTFQEKNLPAFYEEVAGHLESMKAEGAEATILYIHWGVEYQLTENTVQNQIAQSLCDLGIDVIIGGHPHVIQPVELLTSTVDPDHKTVCLYSMGNAVSNQRLGNLNSVSTAHTEDGVLFSVTFSKYSDDTVYLESVDLIPVWVYLRSDNTGNEYNMLPLHMDLSEQWGELFDIREGTVNSAKNSHARTMAIVGEGLTECQTYLEQAYNDREEYYYNLAFFPEMFATQPTEASQPTAEADATLPEETVN